MFALVAGRFAQVESRRRARMYVLGLLSGAERKNSWTIAEQAGDLTPDGMQRLLNFYSWDADQVHGPGDVAAPISSGSFRTDGMIIVLCSMKTLAAVRTGYGEGLNTARSRCDAQGATPVGAGAQRAPTV